MKKSINVREGNIIISTDTEGKTTVINLDRVDYWKKDNNYTEVHLFNCNFSVWINMNEEDFRKNYIKYKKELNE